MKQLRRFLVVGIVSNLCAYLAYLLLTTLSVGPKTAMTLVYAIGTAVGYVGNYRWTFECDRDVFPTLCRYGLAYTSGYLLNLALLQVLVDRLLYPHQIVQAVAIPIVAAYLFMVLQRVVFANKPSDS